MLVLGVCNPRGEADSYNGLYFRQAELSDMVASKKLHGLPVRTEHGTGDIGNIISTYVRSDGGHCEQWHTNTPQGRPALAQRTAPHLQPRLSMQNGAAA